ncbi:uncharacterized protein I206_100426 [Kwoniella pini CBS 10737]|uniref:Uncharacterized protein n=1 Tax=Kwoniella pini CBS 10737 TaxID=1296096 RepID=A0A1B9IDU8_9TREE|nr:uncharacterized protein I206_00899 [Kwoniella pini CBS 10737]OCF53594.1 hypothetical protein I206_00899 [Kwoniella pini CBS 10737]
MMYTPTPATRRPRPPNSLARSRQRQPLISSNSEPIFGLNETRSIPTPSTVVDKLQGDDSNTSVSAYRKQRQDDARNNLARISASPADVSFALDIDASTPESYITAIANGGIADESNQSGSVGLGVSSSSLVPTLSSHSEPSPPPPYGPTLTNTSDSLTSILTRPPTPPQQDSGRSSRRVSSSPSQVSKICDSSAEGLVDDSPEHNGGQDTMGGEESQREDSEDGLSEREVRYQLKEVRSLLLQREEELLIAARVAEQALGSHEKIMSVLPDRLKFHLPDLQEGCMQSDDSVSTSLPMDRPQIYRPTGTSITGSQSFGYLPSVAQLRSRPSSAYHPVEVVDTSPERPEDQFYWDPRAQSDITSLHLPPHYHKPPISIFGAQPTTTAQPPTPRYDRLAALQTEAEDRIIDLEQALSEARAGEEAQRRTAARWRKEANKMQRELAKADEQRVQSEQDALRESVVGQAGSRNRVDQSRVKIKAGVFEHGIAMSPKQHGLGWDYTSFPDFLTAGPSGIRLPHSSRRGKAFDSSILEDGINQNSTQMGGRTVPADDLDSLSVTPSEVQKETASIGRKAAAAVRSSFQHLSPNNEVKVLKRMTSRFTSPSPRKIRFRSPSEADSVKKLSKVLTPRVTIESSLVSPSLRTRSRRTSADGSQKSNTSIRRSPYPLPRPSNRDDSPEARRTIDFLHMQAMSREGSMSPSISPAFASLSSKMASVRAQINRSLSLDPSLGPGMGRTLGSELGSEYGDEWDRGIRSLENIQWERNQPHSVKSPSPSPSPPSKRSTSLLVFSNDDSESENDLDHSPDEDTSVTYLSPVYQPAYPLPAGVSAALSSLATALKPTSIFPTSPSPSLKVPAPNLVHRQWYRRSDNDVSKDIDQDVTVNVDAGVEVSSINWASQGQDRQLPPKISSSLPRTDDVLNNSMRPLKMKASPAQQRTNHPLLSQTASGRKIHAKRATTFGVGHRESPRKYALAHRRINLSFRQSPRNMADGKSLIDNKCNSKYGMDSLLPMLPDQTLTKRGIRYIRNSTEVNMDEISKTSSREIQTVQEDQNARRQNEPSTIPAKIVHDMFCLISIWLEYIEWFIILGIRFYMDIRDGPRGPSGVRHGDRPKRYHI